MRDVVVVGAGHNALVAACYLAREGLDVEVVERDTVLGGAVSTVERWPGFLVDRGSTAHVMVRHTGIVEELRLEDCGLSYVDLDPWAYAPSSGLTFSVDLGATCESIAAVCGEEEADAYARFAVEWAERARRVFEVFCHPPTPVALGRAMWGLGRGTPGAELARQFLQPADGVLDSAFHDERLKTALAWLAAQSGPPPWEVGTAGHLVWVAALHDRAPGHPVGGSGALTRALAARLGTFGGTVRLGDGATEIRTQGGHVSGVVTSSGDLIPTRTVVAGCHVLTTVGLLGDPGLLDATRRRLRVGNGIGMAVRLATTGLPPYPDAPSNAWNGMQLLATSRAQLATAYGDFAAGRPARDPAAVVLTPSAVDGTLAPDGHHTVTVWGQWHPYALADGASWDAIADAEGRRLVAAVESAAPGFASSVEQTWVQTPVELERSMGLLRGNVMHVEMGLDAMFALRPLPEWAGYRGPRPGLYLCGASTHPGGGVSGASGRSAARAVLADRRPRWRRLPF